MTKLKAWLMHFWWLPPAVLLLVLTVITADLYLTDGLPIPHKRSLDGYMLVFDLQDVYDYGTPAPVPLSTEPAHIELDGRIHYSQNARTRYIGKLELDGYHLMGSYLENNGMLKRVERPADAGDDQLIFALYDSRMDKAAGYHQGDIRSSSGNKGILHLINEKGDEPWLVYSQPDREKYCILVDIEREPGVFQWGFMVFPSSTPEEALEIFTNEHLAVWRAAMETESDS